MGKPPGGPWAVPLRSLGGPWASLGRPWGSQDGPWASLGGLRARLAERMDFLRFS